MLYNQQSYTSSSLIYPVTLYIKQLIKCRNLHILQSHIYSDLYIQQPYISCSLYIYISNYYFQPPRLSCKKNELTPPKANRGIGFTALILQKHPLAPKIPPYKYFGGLLNPLAGAKGLRCREWSNSVHAKQLGRRRLVSSRCKKKPAQFY